MQYITIKVLTSFTVTGISGSLCQNITQQNKTVILTY